MQTEAFPYPDYSYRDQFITTSHRVSTSHSEEFYLHCHDVYEIYYFISGDVSYLVEGREYRPATGSAFLFYPNIFHGFRVNSSQPYERCTLHFPASLLSPENAELLLSPFQAGHTGGEVYYPDGKKYGLETCFAQLFQAAQGEEDLRSMAVRLRLENLLLQALLMSRESRATLPRPVQPLAGEILSYINENLSQPMSLDSLAGRFFISKYQLGTLFKKATGTTVMDYIIRKRLAAARQLIAQGIHAGDAALRSGFGDYSVFFRAYKKVYGCAPVGAVRRPGNTQGE